MSPLASSAAHSRLPLPPSESQSSEILATAFNKTACISEPCSHHLPDSFSVILTVGTRRTTLKLAIMAH